MKIYLDTGNIEEIKKAVNIGLIDGVTTNPSLIAKEGRDFKTVIKEIVKLLKTVSDDFTVSAEVTSLTAEEMVVEALPLSKIDKHVIIKLPLIPEGLKACRILSKKGIRCNLTLCFSSSQALLAAKAGAWCVSPFLGRLDDISQDGIQLIEEIKEIFENYNFKTKILAASIRSPKHVAECSMIGADMATIPPKVYHQLFNHPLTTSGLKKFLDDWRSYKSKV